MNIDEIKKYLKIDLKQKNRKELYIYLKCIYINQEKNKGFSFNKIGRDLELKSHASVINILKRTDDFKLDPFFMYVQKAYDNKDDNYIKEYYKMLGLRYKEQRQTHKEKLLKKIKRIEQPKEFEFIKPEIEKKPHIFEVGKNLRKIDTPLANKQYNKWTEKDFKQYFKLINNETSTKQPI